MTSCTRMKSSHFDTVFDWPWICGATGTMTSPSRMQSSHLEAFQSLQHLWANVLNDVNSRFCVDTDDVTKSIW